MQRDGSLIMVFPCGSTNMIEGSGASNTWLLQELIGRNDIFSYVFPTVVAGSLLNFLICSILINYTLSIDMNSKYIFNRELDYASIPNLFPISMLCFSINSYLFTECESHYLCPKVIMLILYAFSTQSMFGIPYPYQSGLIFRTTKGSK